MSKASSRQGRAFVIVNDSERYSNTVKARALSIASDICVNSDMWLPDVLLKQRHTTLGNTLEDLGLMHYCRFK